jgi:hypothetical protein
MAGIVGALALALVGYVAGRADAAGGAAHVPGAVAAHAAVDAVDDGPAAALAHAFQAALAAHDSSGLLALFAVDGSIKERYAFLAAGRSRLAAWIADCLTPRLVLVPGSLQVSGDTATWAFEDFGDCYWRSRPDTLRPSWSVLPAEGTASIIVRDDAIASFTYTYSQDWEARLLAAQAAPILTAQAQATQRVGPPGGVSTPTPAPPPAADAAMAKAYPAAPDTQARTMPSPAWWVVAILLSLLGVGAIGGATARSGELTRRQ